MTSLLNLTSRRLAVAFGVIAIAVAVGACGSSASSSSTSVAAAGGTGLSAGSTTARLKLAKCFRAHGINVSDSGSTTTGGGAGGGIFQAFRQYPRAEIQAAMTACRQYLLAAFPRANLTPAQRSQRTQQLVKYAACMRSHGVNIPDPTTTTGGGAGGGFGFAGGGSSLRALLNTPAGQAANKSCASLRPTFGGGRFGGGAPGAGGGSGAAGA